jgi:pimeloyl-ACP methyl ester carboxylesterase
MLTTWSLGKQDDLTSAIEQLNLPILWLTGEHDASFCQVAEKIKFSHIHSRTSVIPAMGHRLLHEASNEIIKEWPWEI